MINVLTIHILIIIIAVALSYKGVLLNIKESPKCFIFNQYYLLSFISMLLFIGLRAFLGRDWYGYERIFDNPVQSFVFGESREFGFLLLCQCLKTFGLGFKSFIFMTTLIMLILFWASFRNLYRLIPYSIFIFFVFLAYPFVINGIRQGIAVMAFVAAIGYINEDRGLFSFSIFMTIAILFHNSAILLCLAYFIKYINIKYKTIILTSLIAFILSYFFVSEFYNYLLSFFPKYEYYLDNSNVYSSNSTFGLGALLLLFIRLLPLCFYNQITTNIPKMKIYYFLYYLGLGLYYPFYKFLLITRFTYYLQFCEIFIGSALLFYCCRISTNRKGIGYAYILLIMINYIYTFGDFIDDQAVENKISLLLFDFNI